MGGHTHTGFRCEVGRVHAARLYGHADWKRYLGDGHNRTDD